jgi:hypothetical protein
MLLILESCQSTVQLASNEKPAQKEPRTVFGELPKPDSSRQRLAPIQAPESESKPTKKPEVQSESPRETVTRVVYRWAQTSSPKDLSRHINLYAHKLDRFYDETNVGRESVKREKQRALRRSPVGSQQIRDLSLRVQDEGRLVIAEFQREFIRAGMGKETVHQRLVWKRLAEGDWKIIREETL